MASHGDPPSRIPASTSSTSPGDAYVAKSVQAVASCSATGAPMYSSAIRWYIRLSQLVRGLVVSHRTSQPTTASSDTAASCQRRSRAHRSTDQVYGRSLAPDIGAGVLIGTGPMADRRYGYTRPMAEELRPESPFGLQGAYENIWHIA